MTGLTRRPRLEAERSWGRAQTNRLGAHDAAASAADSKDAFVASSTLYTSDSFDNGVTAGSSGKRMLCAGVADAMFLAQRPRSIVRGASGARRCSAPSASDRPECVDVSAVAVVASIVARCTDYEAAAVTARAFVESYDVVYGVIDSLLARCEALERSYSTAMMRLPAAYDRAKEEILSHRSHFCDRQTEQSGDLYELVNRIVTIDHLGARAEAKKKLSERVDVYSEELSSKKLRMLEIALHLQLQVSFCELLVLLRARELPHWERTTPGTWYEAILARFRNCISTEQAPPMHVKSQDELDIKNLNLNLHYCNLTPQLLSRLDAITGEIVNSSTSLRRDCIKRVQSIVVELSNAGDSPGTSCVDVPIYKAQRVVYVLTRILMGHHDAVLTRAYTFKQREQDRMAEKDMQRALELFEQRHARPWRSEAMSFLSKRDAVLELYERQRKQSLSEDGCLSLIRFDRNTCYVLEAERERASDSGDQYTYNFTNVNGVLANVITQTGNAFSKGVFNAIAGNTIGTAFYINLIGGNGSLVQAST